MAFFWYGMHFAERVFVCVCVSSLDCTCLWLWQLVERNESKWRMQANACTEKYKRNYTQLAYMTNVWLANRTNETCTQTEKINRYSPAILFLEGHFIQWLSLNAFSMCFNKCKRYISNNTHIHFDSSVKRNETNESKFLRNWICFSSILLYASIHKLWIWSRQLLITFAIWNF